MDRNDFIETREDIVQNIKTLYSYLDGKVDSEHKYWAIQRMSQGKNYVIEVVDSQIYFAPSRFVGYVDNTMEKHEWHRDSQQNKEFLSESTGCQT